MLAAAGDGDASSVLPRPKMTLQQYSESKRTQGNVSANNTSNTSNATFGTTNNSDSSGSNNTVIHQALYCPLSKKLSTDAVTAADGYTYDRQTIESYFLQKDVSPMTNEILAVNCKS